MGMAFKTVRVLTGQLQTLEFGQEVGASIVGVNGFHIFFPGDQNRWLGHLGLDVTAPATSGTQVAATPTLRMADGSGNANNADSWIDLTAVAWLGASASKSVVFAQRDGIQAPTDSLPIALSGEQLTVAASLLRGFELSYPKDEDHCLRSVSVRTGQSVATNRNEARLNVAADMCDNSGNSVAERVVSAGFLGATASAQLEARVLQIADDKSEWASFTKPVTQAAVLLTGFSIDNPGDMEICQLSVTANIHETKDKQVRVHAYARWLSRDGDSVKPGGRGKLTVIVLSAS